jgi:hypothetical protein
MNKPLQTADKGRSSVLLVMVEVGEGDGTTKPSQWRAVVNTEMDVCIP